MLKKSFDISLLNASQKPISTSKFKIFSHELNNKWIISESKDFYNHWLLKSLDSANIFMGCPCLEFLALGIMLNLVAEIGFDLAFSIYILV